TDHAGRNAAAGSIRCRRGYRLGAAASAAPLARRKLEVAVAGALAPSDRSRHGNRCPGCGHVGVACPFIVQPRARKLRLAYRAARLLLCELAYLLVGDAASARAELRPVRRLPVRDIADRR